MSELSSVLLCRQFQWIHPGLELLHPAIDLQLQNKAQALVGLNGCGKSLFLRCLAGQETGLAYSGELLWQQPFVLSSLLHARCFVSRRTQLSLKAWI